MSADPLHTHKWTVAVRSAASNPLPTHLFDDQGAPVPTSVTATPSTGAAAGTRGRDTETDYHKHVGGKDDISHFIRRVQFKLHESFPQAVRTCDRPPYQVTETGWGEFEVQIKIWWVAESGEKPLQTFHYLKLHPWNPLPVAAAAVSETTAADTSVGTVAGGEAPAATTEQASATAEEGQTDAAASTEKAAGDPVANSSTTDGAAPEPATAAAAAATPAPAAAPAASGEEAAPADTSMTEAGASTSAAAPTTPAPSAAAPALPAAPAISLPPVVHSWQYDEVVFPEPTEAMQETFRLHPPTPLPTTASQAFTDPKTSRLQRGFSTTSSPQPPYPLHAPSSQPYLYGISQASMQAEADRLDIARIEAVRELEKERNRLIEAERELRRVRQKTEALLSGKGAGATTTGAGMRAGSSGR